MRRQCSKMFVNSKNKVNDTKMHKYGIALYRKVSMICMLLYIMRCLTSTKHTACLHNKTDNYVRFRYKRK